MTTLRALLAAGLVVVGFGVAVAKLPPPPPMTEQEKAAAEEKKAKAATAAAAAKAALERAEDRVVARYMAEQKAKGSTIHPGSSAPASTGAPAGPAGAAGGSAVTTAQGNTPPGPATGQPADAAARDSNKK